MKTIFLAKKNLTAEKPVAKITDSGNYIHVECGENGILAILRELYKQQAFRKINRNGAYYSVPIKDKSESFEYNVLHKLPAPYYLDPKSRPLEKVEVEAYWKKGEMPKWENIH